MKFTGNSYIGITVMGQGNFDLLVATQISHLISSLLETALC